MSDNGIGGNGLPENEGGAASCPETAEAVQAPAVKQRTTGEKILAEILDWGRSIIIAVALALVIKATIVQAYMIPTGSMEHTIMPNDRVFGNRFVYHIHKPERGDIIAFKPPDTVQDTRIPFLKRVIAVEGDDVYMHNGAIYVNGKKTVEPYLMEPPLGEMQPRHVPPDTIFVMGDNRNSSYDSRYFGFVPIKNIQAKAFFRFWPLDRIGVLH